MNYQYYSDLEYGRILDNIVVACVDVVIKYGDFVLLERRNKNPLKNKLWILGGRMAKGEPFEIAAKHALEREIGISLSESRFKKGSFYNLIWPVRNEDPVNNGCHHLLIAMYIEIDDTEYKLINDTVLNKPKDRNLEWLEISSLNKLKDVPKKLNEIIHCT